jgi:hypothetical protein
MLLGIGSFPQEYENTFDVVVASGVWLKGHIPASGLNDVYSALKVGGHLFTAMRDQYYQVSEPEGYKDKLDTLCLEGKLIFISKTELTRGNPGGTDLMKEMKSV